MTDQHLHGLEESLEVGPPQNEPATLASIILSCMRDRPLAVYVGEDRSLKCVPARALGEIEIDDIVGVYSPKAELDAIADDIRAYVEARFGVPCMPLAARRAAA
jgi:hypothetical protein